MTHIGFTDVPGSLEVDLNVDTVLAAQTTGIDMILGGHSHTDPSKKTLYSGDYQYLPTFVGSANGTPVLINHSYRYNNYLTQNVIGLLPGPAGQWRVITRGGRYQAVTMSTPEDAAVKAVVDPYMTLFNAYNNTVIGQTTMPIDALNAYTEETNGANLQADAGVHVLTKNGINVDFHLSGAMSNRKVAATATPDALFDLKVSDMFTLMPYENSLLVMSMNGPQLKTVLERVYSQLLLLQIRARLRRLFVLHHLHAGHQCGQCDHLQRHLPEPAGLAITWCRWWSGGQPIDFTDAYERTTQSRP